MIANHNTPRETSAPVTPPRRSREPATPTPPSLRRELKTPPRQMQIPLPLPQADANVSATSSAQIPSFPLTLPHNLALDLPVETTTESHDLFRGPLYYQQETTSLEGVASMSLGMSLDLDVDMELGLGMNDVDLGRVMHMPDDINTTCQGLPMTIPLALPLTTMPTTTMAPTPRNGQQLFRNDSAPPSMFLFDESNTNQSKSSAYGDPENYSMGPKTVSSDGNAYDAHMIPAVASPSYHGFFMPLPRDPTPVTSGPAASFSTFGKDPSPPLARSRTCQTRGFHSVDQIVVDSIIPSIEGQDAFGHNHNHAVNGYRQRRGSSNSVESVDDDNGYESKPTAHHHETAGPNGTPNINGPPPPDPSDWRARLRYCEQAVHKASLDASLVRLLEFPEGLDACELEARRGANLRFDRVREQRLKDRNNEAAKRSRQRKVQRIEKAELQVEKMTKERETLAAEVADLKKQLAALMAVRESTPNKPLGMKVLQANRSVSSIHPERRVNDCQVSRRTRSSGHIGRRVTISSKSKDKDMDVDMNMDDMSDDGSDADGHCIADTITVGAA
ncbi:hypothetical protein SEUCBS139899_002401 [Sporothrix eucalyptigena]|uniref:BZIP domain-containing protein n=1 Tax=Sporothrix eucalyptigena TaxID=1812306 RepID=A0ABP0B1I9_9PEZI